MRRMKKVFNRRAGRRIAAGMLAALLLAAAFISQRSAVQAETTAEGHAADGETVSEEPAGTAAGSGKEGNDSPDKEESVYVRTDASGNPMEISVEVLLHAGDEGAVIRDNSCLTGIRNTKGEETWKEGAYGDLFWENLGEDIEYKGTAGKELPFGISITYFLDGEEIAPEELAGQSGTVRIRCDYENRSGETGADGGTEKNFVPYLAVTALLLPDEQFSSISVTNGRTVRIGEQTMVIGYALPGLREALRLDDHEQTEEISIPEYLEVTAEADEFELTFNETVVTNGLFSDLTEDSLTDLDELTDAMEDLDEACGEIGDGIGELLDGFSTYRDYLSQYTDGVSSLNEGMQALNSGIHALRTQLSAVDPDALMSGGDDSSVKNALSAAQADYAYLAENVPKLRSAADTILQFVTDAAVYSGTVEGTVNAAVSELSSVTLPESTDLSGTAREQAMAALSGVLSSADLTEEQQASLLAAAEQAFSEQISVASPGAGDAAAHLSAAQQMLSSLPSLALPSASLDPSGIQSAAEDLQTQVSILLPAVSALSGQAKTAVSALQSAVETLDAASGQLASGAGTLASSGSALLQGADGLSEGCEALQDGFRTFREEGIEELRKTFGDELSDLLDRVRAVRDADLKADTYSGLALGKTGSVRYIFEADEIEAD